MKDRIEQHLEMLSFVDPEFEAKYRSGAKTLDGCISYIMSKASDKLNGTTGFIEDGIVFGWAREYFTDDTLDCERKTLQETQTMNPPKPKDAPEENANPAPAKAQAPASNQLSIFDIEGV